MNTLVTPIIGKGKSHNYNLILFCRVLIKLQVVCYSISILKLILKTLWSLGVQLFLMQRENKKWLTTK